MATVDDTSIHQVDVRKLSPPMSPGDATSLLVDFALIDAAAQKHHIVVTDGELSKLRDGMVAQQNGETFDEVAKKLHETSYGLTLQLRHARMLEDLAALELSQPPTEMIHVRGILIRSDGRHASNPVQALSYARSLLARIKAGTGFAIVAKEQSEDKVSAPLGGDLGIIESAIPAKPTYDMDNTFTNAMLKAAVTGSVSNPVRGDHGYWIVQIISTMQHPGEDDARYLHVLSYWRSFWIDRLEPGVMARLRQNAVVNPPFETASSDAPARGIGSRSGGQN